MKKVIMLLTLLMIGVSIIGLAINNSPYAYHSVINTSNIPSKLEADQAFRITVEFTIYEPKAIFGEVFINEQEYVETRIYTTQVLKNLDNGYTVIQVEGRLLINEPTVYDLKPLGITYSMGEVEHRYLMDSIHIMVYSPVRLEASVSAQVICLGQPLLYEAQIITEKEAGFEYSQDVVRRQVTETEYGYLVRLWLLYTEPGKYEVVPMQVTSQYKVYYPSPIQITIVPFKANLSFSSKAVKVGEPLDFTIEIKPLEKGFKIEHYLSAWGKFKVDNLKIDTNGNYKISGRLTLFEPAGNEYLLGPIGFRYTHEGETNIFYLPVIPVWLQKTITSDAYQLREPQYGRDLHMPIWNFAVLCLLFIAILLSVIKVVKIVRARKPKKEEGISYRQKLSDALQGEDWMTVACLIKQKIGESGGLTAEQSLSLTLEECEMGSSHTSVHTVLKILQAVDKKLFADEPIDLTIDSPFRKDLLNFIQ